GAHHQCNPRHGHRNPQVPELYLPALHDPYDVRDSNECEDDGRDCNVGLHHDLSSSAPEPATYLTPTTISVNQSARTPAIPPEPSAACARAMMQPSPLSSCAAPRAQHSNSSFAKCFIATATTSDNALFALASSSTPAITFSFASSGFDRAMAQSVH